MRSKLAVLRLDLGSLQGTEGSSFLVWVMYKIFIFTKWVDHHPIKVDLENSMFPRCVSCQFPVLNPWSPAITTWSQEDFCAAKGCDEKLDGSKMVKHEMSVFEKNHICMWLIHLWRGDIIWCNHNALPQTRFLVDCSIRPCAARCLLLPLKWFGIQQHCFFLGNQSCMQCQSPVVSGPIRAEFELQRLSWPLKRSGSRSSCLAKMMIESPEVPGWKKIRQQ